MSERRKALIVLTLNTLAFAESFMCSTFYGLLITYLIRAGLFRWTPAEIVAHRDTSSQWVASPFPTLAAWRAQRHLEDKWVDA